MEEVRDTVAETKGRQGKVADMEVEINRMKVSTSLPYFNFGSYVLNYFYSVYNQIYYKS